MTRVSASRGDLTFLFLRATVALVFLWHGVPKAIDIAGAADKFVGFGLPGWLGPVVGWAEVPAAVLLLLGLWHRAAAGVLGVIILGAIATVQLPAGIAAGLERDILLLVAILVLLANGPGAYAVDAPVPRRLVGVPAGEVG